MFLDMPLTAQALYFHLAMRADDDGFVNNPKKIQRMIGSNEDDMKLLIAKGYLIIFDSGIVVIRHWKVHNYIRSDRYKSTIYDDEYKTLEVINNTYQKMEEFGIPDVIPTVAKMDTQDRLGKDRDRIEIGKDRIDYQQIADMYNATCVSYPRLVSLSENRKKAIKARLNTYTIEQIQEVFTKAEASDFMKGANNRNWSATFDWMMKDGNFAKILDGNYDNRKPNTDFSVKVSVKNEKQWCFDSNQDDGQELPY